jgi:hypothetical protein
VEYLQQQLNQHLDPKPNLKVDGDFGAATYKALRAYQTQAGIQVDGVAGNQTWASLRHGPAEKPSTDGRPRGFQDVGVKARWFTEDDVIVYAAKSDTLSLFPVSVGTEAKLEGATVNVFVTPPGGKRKGLAAKVGPAVSARKTKTGEGQVHEIKIPNFMKTFPATPPATIDKYVVEAYFDSALGGDFWSTTKGAIAVIS